MTPICGCISSSCHAHSDKKGKYGQETFLSGVSKLAFDAIELVVEAAVLSAVQNGSGQPDSGISKFTLSHVLGSE